MKLINKLKTFINENITIDSAEFNRSKLNDKINRINRKYLWKINPQKI